MSSFTVANINPGVARTEMWLSFLDLKDADIAAFLGQFVNDNEDPDLLRLDHIWSRISPPMLDIARNHMITGFLDHTTGDHLVFIDADVAPKVEDYYALVGAARHHGLGSLSGVYHTPLDGAIRPVVYRDLGTMETYDPEELDKMDPVTPVPVAGTGAGFLCLSRDLLEDMRTEYPAPKHWFECGVRDGYQYGEDIGLAFRIAEMGMSQWVLPGLVALHSKTMQLGR